MGQKRAKGVMGELTYITEWNRMSLYVNSDGHIEAYRRIGRNQTPYSVTPVYEDMERIVTNVSTVEEFKKFYEGRREEKISKIKEGELLKNQASFIDIFPVKDKK